MKKRKSSRKAGRQRARQEQPLRTKIQQVTAPQPGDLAGAARICEAILQSTPDDVATIRRLADVRERQGNRRENIALLERARHVAPHDASVLFDLAVSCGKAGRILDATKYLRDCIAREPGNATACYELGNMSTMLGDADGARDAYLHCLLADPGHLKARWYLAQCLPRVYMTTSEIDLWRDRVSTATMALAAGTRLDTLDEVKDAVSAVFSAGPNFLVAYQQDDHRKLQEVSGALASRIMYAGLGKIALPPMPDRTMRRRRDRMRIGYASENLCIAHTISLLFHGWIDEADRDRFEIHVFHLNDHTDSNTETIARKCDVFHRVERSLALTAQSIRNADLDVLVYPDIGMGAFSYALAALRLAPVQCVSWGHPDTTGLPTIDYFLSSDLMEPEGSEAYYSERLVKLPNLSIFYYPKSVDGVPRGERKGRSHFGLPEDSCIFLCSQATQKYLPDYDDIFPRIAERVGRCRFVFIEHRLTEIANRRFRTRLRAAFQRYGKTPDDYLHFLPWQPWYEYLALNAASDVFLDSVGWSGGNTTLEALAQGMPVVTLPGRFMRGRHTYAMLRRVGADACIANSLDQYVEIAVRLANDDMFYDDQVAIIRDGLRLLYRDRSAIEGLEAFYQSLFDDAPESG